jgi:hypothetical protein
MQVVFGLFKFEEKNLPTLSLKSRKVKDLRPKTINRFWVEKVITKQKFL